MITIVIHRASRETLRKDLKFLVKTCDLEGAHFTCSNRVRIDSGVYVSIEIVGFVGNNIDILDNMEPDFYQIPDARVAYQFMRKTNGIELHSISQIVTIVDMFKDRSKGGSRMKVDGTCLITDVEKPCIVCKKLTNRFNYCYEAPICSDECEDVMDTKVSKMEEECKDIPL